MPAASTRLVIFIAIVVYCVLVCGILWARTEPTPCPPPLIITTTTQPQTQTQLSALSVSTQTSEHRAVSPPNNLTNDSTILSIQANVPSPQRPKDRTTVEIEEGEAGSAEPTSRVLKSVFVNVTGLSPAWGNRLRRLWMTRIAKDFGPTGNGLFSPNATIIEYDSDQGFISASLAKGLSPSSYVISVESRGWQQGIHRQKRAFYQLSESNLICVGKPSMDVFQYFNERRVFFDIQLLLRFFIWASEFHVGLTPLIVSPRDIDASLAAAIRSARTTYFTLPDPRQTMDRLWTEWFGNRSVIDAVAHAAIHHDMEVQFRQIGHSASQNNRSFVLLRADYLPNGPRRGFHCRAVRELFQCAPITDSQKRQCKLAEQLNPWTRQASLAKSLNLTQLPVMALKWPLRVSSLEDTRNLPVVSHHLCSMPYFHHGVTVSFAYQIGTKVVLELNTASGRFVFKPSCRPPYNMYHYQEVAELLALGVAATLEYPLYVPCTYGTVVRLTEAQREPLLACPEWRRDQDGYFHVYGTVTEFLEIKREKVPAFLLANEQYFVPKARLRVPAEKRKAVREYVQYATFQYLLGNLDGEKNFFRSSDGRLLVLDNGLSFGGEEVNESVCSTMETLLNCSRYVPGSHLPPMGVFTCQNQTKYNFCLFNRDDLLHLRNRAENFITEFSPSFLLQDFLLNHRLHEPWSQSYMDGRVWHELEFDYVMEPKRNAVPAQGSNTIFSFRLMRQLTGCPYVRRNKRAYNSSELIFFVAHGIVKRIQRLVRHAQWCAKEFGEDYVFQL